MLADRELLATGRTSEIYLWVDERVLKLLLPDVMPEWAEIECTHGAGAKAAGLPVPDYGEVLEIDGRRGFTMDYIRAPSLLDRLVKQPWLAGHWGKILARTHARVHACPAPPDWQAQKDWLCQDVESDEILPAGKKDALLRLLDGLPGGEQICHGDFHPNNIFITSSGPLIIDWLTATRGNPLADLAHSIVLINLGKSGSWLIEQIRQRFLHAYQKEYLSLTQLDPASLPAWKAINAASFLKDARAGDRPGLLALIEQGLALA